MIINRFIAIVLCVVIAFLGTEACLATDHSINNGKDTYTEGSAYTRQGGMPLKKGTYVEHEVLVLYQSGSEVEQSDVVNRKLIKTAEPVGEVSIDAVEASMNNAVEVTAQAVMGQSAENSADNSNENEECIVKGTATEIKLVRDESMSTEELIDKLSGDPHVLSVEPNWITTDQSPKQFGSDCNQAGKTQIIKPTNRMYSTAKATEQTAAGRTDINLNSKEQDNGTSDATKSNGAKPTAADATGIQWEINNDGMQLGGGRGADMGFSAAREQKAPDGIEDVIVAVIDSGVDARHDDLELWEDPGNIGLMGKYEGADKHGFSEDNMTSYDYIDRDHGTHVAGTVGAKWNGIGTSGVAPNARIMSVRHHDNYLSFVRCFQYIKAACEAGVKVRVINNSWGGGSYTSFIMDSLIRELGEKYNVVSVFSAGNSAADDDITCCVPSILVQNPYTIVVGAVGPDGRKASFSNWGADTVNIFAPGVQILSTLVTELLEDEVTCPYIGELDAERVMLQSFDDSSEEALLTFNELIDSTKAEISSRYSFQGGRSLLIPSSEMEEGDSERKRTFLFSSDKVNMSEIAGKPEYIGFRAYAGATGGELSFGSCTINTTEGTEKLYNYDDDLTSTSRSWSDFYFELPENTDWANFQITLEVCMDDEDNVYDDFDLYLDNIILGNSPHNYTYMSGTSMAAPAVSGEVAVVCGMHPEASAEEIVARVLAGTNQDDNLSFDGLCTSEELANVDRAIGNRQAPYITDVTREDDGTATIEGWFITENCTAKARISRRGNFAGIDIINRQIDGRKGKVRVKLPENYTGGEIWFTLSNKEGKSPVKYAKFGTDKETIKYDECDIEIPEEINDVISTWDGWTLTAFNGYVYFLHKSHSHVFESESSMNEMIRYNISGKTWEIFELPLDKIRRNDRERIYGYGAVEYKGKFYVTVNSVEDGTYNILTTVLTMDNRDQWTVIKSWDDYDCPIDSHGYTLASDGNILYAVGGTEGSIYRWSDKEQTFYNCGNCTNKGPECVVLDDRLLVSGGNNRGLAEETVSGVAIISHDSEDSGLFESGKVDFAGYTDNMRNMYFGIARVKDGIVAVGPRSVDGTTDTYFIPYSRPAAGQPLKLKAKKYGKSAYDAPLYRPAATTYKNRLYVLATTGEGDRHVFSATAFATEDNNENKKDNPVVHSSPATKIIKLKKLRKGFKVRWSKKNCSGYQIRYSRKSSMKNAKIKTVSKASKIIRAVRKLKAHKKYYVQVRTYSKVKGIKYYSKWSRKKTVITR